MSEQLLQVRNLSVSVEDKPILHGIDLEVRPGETHVLMGPNGAGKSTLGYTIMGSPDVYKRQRQFRCDFAKVVPDS